MLIYSKTCVKRPLKNRQNRVLITNCSLMKVEKNNFIEIFYIIQYIHCQRLQDLTVSYKLQVLQKNAKFKEFSRPLVDFRVHI